jgi:glycosyltransferase involved in cell wall biosynthesis
VFAALIPRLMGATVILDIHDIVPELYASKFRISQGSLIFRLLVLVERLSVRFSSHVVVANHVWCERLINRSAASPTHCTTIINYPDMRLFRVRPRASSCASEFLICYPGTLSWHQGVDLVLEAMAQLRRDAPGIRLLLLGDGSERNKLAFMAKKLGIETRVRIVGGVPLEAVAETIARVDLGVEPKRKRSFANEALSTKILEFMAVGVPVLAADTYTHRLYFEDRLLQFFESENVDDLSAKILELMCNSSKRNALRARGLEFIRENNWDVKKWEYLDLIDRLMKRPHRNLDTAASPPAA